MNEIPMFRIFNSVMKQQKIYKICIWYLLLDGFLGTWIVPKNITLVLYFNFIFSFIDSFYSFILNV